MAKLDEVVLAAVVATAQVCPEKPLGQEQLKGGEFPVLKQSPPFLQGSGLSHLAGVVVIVVVTVKVLSVVHITVLLLVEYESDAHDSHTRFNTAVAFWVM
jgi:hypothetical protein